MNKLSATLLDASESVFQPKYDINPIIGQYELRSGTPYLSGVHTVTAVLGPFGIPYKLTGLAMQTCSNFYISAPEPYQASSITHKANVLYTLGQAPVGQAPVSGIYTGVDDGCS